MSYVKNTWDTGDVVTADKLNHIEDGISSAASGGGNSVTVYISVSDSNVPRIPYKDMACTQGFANSEEYWNYIFGKDVTVYSTYEGELYNQYPALYIGFVDNQGYPTCMGVQIFDTSVARMWEVVGFEVTDEPTV